MIQWWYFALTWWIFSKELKRLCVASVNLTTNLWGWQEALTPKCTVSSIRKNWTQAAGLTHWFQSRVYTVGTHSVLRSMDRVSNTASSAAFLAYFLCICSSWQFSPKCQQYRPTKPGTNFCRACECVHVCVCTRVCVPIWLLSRPSMVHLPPLQHAPASVIGLMPCSEMLLLQKLKT